MSAQCPLPPDVSAVPGIPRDADGAVFGAPWEAKAFALVVHLHQRGCFEWQEWVDCLSAEIAADRDRPQETPYYLLWLTAAEALVVRKRLVGSEALTEARNALHAAQPTHHAHHDEHDHV